jgi:hypothetical protein
MARDHIERLMKKIREVTVVQFIAYGEDGRYTLDLTIVDDYDAKIEQKAKAAVDEAEVQQAFRNLVEAELSLKEQMSLLAGQSVYPDTAPWPSRRAFRPGVLASATGSGMPSSPVTTALSCRDRCPAEHQPPG